MKKRISLFAIVFLCLPLSGCSAGGGMISGGVLAFLGLAAAFLAMSRSRSLARLRRKRRLTRKQRAWLRDQMAVNSVLNLIAAVLVLIGLVVCLVSWLVGAGEPPAAETTPPVPTQTVTEPTDPPTDPPTEPTEGMQSTVAPLPTEYTQPEEETEPDLMGIPESLLELMEKNPETTDFVVNYFNRRPMVIDLSDVDRTSGVPLFMQWDPRWGYEIYGSDVIALTGCAPTCMAMVGYYLTGDERFTPDQMAKFAEAGGYYVRDNGTKWTFIGEGAEQLGLSSTELPLDKTLMIRSLRAGHPIIVVVGPGDFTTTGHYIVLTAYEDGKFRVNDPNRYSNSERLWSYEALEPQIRNLWSISAG